MARETTVEVDIEVNTKYSEKVKRAEERLKKVNKVASKMKTPKKPLTEMEKYQQSVDRTYKLLQKLEKQQKSISKLTQIETTLKASVKVTISENKDKQDDSKSECEKKEDKGWFEKGAEIADNIEKYWTLYDRISGLFKKRGNPDNSGDNMDPTILKNPSPKSDSSSSETDSSCGKKEDKGWFEKGAEIADNIEKYGALYDRISGLFKKGTEPTNNNTNQNSSGGMSGLLSLNYSGMLAQLPAVGSKILSFFTGIGSKISGVFSAMFASNPVGLIIIGVIAAIAVFVLLYKKCEWFRNGVNKAFNEIKPYIMQFVEVVRVYAIAIFEKLKAAAEKLKPILIEAFEKAKPYIAIIGEFIKKFIILYIKFVIVYIKIIVQVFKFVWNTIKPIVLTVLDILIKGIKLFIEGIKITITKIIEIFQFVWNMIQPIVMFVLELIILGITTFIETIKIIIDVIVIIFQTVWETVKLIVTIAFEIIVGIITGAIEIITFIINGIVSVFSFIWEQIKIIVQSGIEFICTLWDTITIKVSEVWQGIVNGIGGFIESMKEKVGLGVQWIKNKFTEIASSVPFLGKFIEFITGKNYSGTNYWRGGLTYVGERGRELIQYPTGERFMAESKMLMNLPKGTKIFRNSKTEKMLNKNAPKDKMTTVDENNQLKKLGGFNGLSGYTDFKFGSGAGNTNVQTDNITINITNTYGNQSPTQIKDTNIDLVRKINEVLFQNKDRQRRVSIG